MPESSPAATHPSAPHFARAHLFVDLRGYTDYVETHGDHEGARLIDRYRIFVREALASEGGQEVRTEGDSFYIVFDSASAAVQAGQAIIAAAESSPELPIRLGIGIHAGEAVHTAEGYVGAAVNLAARICAQAGPGELVVSDTVRGLTRTYIDVAFVPLGNRQMKGVSEPIPLFRVVPKGATTEPGAHGRRGGGGRHRLAVVVTVAVMAVVVGGGAVAIITGGLGPSGTPPASPGLAAALASPSPATPAPTRLASASATTAPVASGLIPAGPFPTAPEQALLDTLAAAPDQLAASCRRGPYALLNTDDLGGSNVPVASVECSPPSNSGANDVIVEQFDLSSVKRGFVGGHLSVIQRQHASGTTANGGVTHVGIPAGDCATTPTAAGRWDILGQDRGGLLCFTEPDTGDAVLVWSDDAAARLIYARNWRGDSAALYRYFARTARLIAG